MSKLKAVITGVHGFVPEKRLTNADLEKMVDTNDEWITTRTGIKERRILENDEPTTAMAIPAAQGLLEKTNTKAEDIDLIICATTSPDLIFPAMANLIAEAIGAVNSFGYDVQAACSGFLYSLATASQFVQAGTYKKVMVVGADKMSSIIDYTDRSTCIIFGDGAAAVLLEPDETGETGIMDFNLRSNGKSHDHLLIKAGGTRRPTSHRTVNDREHYLYQEGAVVFKEAVTQMAKAATDLMKRNNLTEEDVNWLAPHQANRRIIDATAKRMGLSPEKVLVTIDHYGNTTNASIPLTLWENEHRLKKGDTLMMAAFGGGFTWGSLYMKWGYNGPKEPSAPQYN